MDEHINPSDEKDWQRGYKLKELKEFAAPWLKHYKPFVHGAFGKVKERDIADALFKHRYYSLLGHEEAAIALEYKVNRTIEDFAGRIAVVHAGDVMVQHLLAFSEIGLRALMARLPASAPRVWFEIFEEDAKTKQLVMKLGARYQMTKISAGSDIKGLYCLGQQPKLEPQRPEDKSSLLILADNFAPQGLLRKVQKEVKEAGQMAQHYSTYNLKKSWTALALHGFDEDPSFIMKPAEMAKRWKEANPERLSAVCGPTAAAPAFPSALALAAKIPGKKERIRFMALEPGGGLSRHADITDADAGLRAGKLARLHIPIETDQACVFHSWSERGQHRELHLPEGALCYLDTRKPHAVDNSKSEARRIHLVVDTWGSDALLAWFSDAKDRERFVGW